MGIQEVRDNLTRTLRRVRARVMTQVMRDGQPVGTVLPARDEPIDQLLAAGDISAPRAVTQPLQRFPVSSGMSATRALEEDRGLR